MRLSGCGGRTTSRSRRAWQALASPPCSCVRAGTPAHARNRFSPSSPVTLGKRVRSSDEGLFPPSLLPCACRHAGAYREIRHRVERSRVRAGTPAHTDYLLCPTRFLSRETWGIHFIYGSHIFFNSAESSEDLCVKPPSPAPFSSHRRCTQHQPASKQISGCGLCVKPPSLAPFTTPVEQRKLPSNNRHIAFDVSNGFSIAYRYACEQKLACERQR